MFAAERRGYEFGNFRLYPAEALLLRDGQPVPVNPKTFKLLCVLVENHGHLVEKDELMREVWPDTFVVESNLTYNISMLRKLLGDDGNGNRFIATLPKHGYRFVREVREIVDTDAPSQSRAQLEVEAAALPNLSQENQPALPRFSRWSKIAIACGALAMLAALIYSARLVTQRVRNAAVAGTLARNGPAAMSSNAQPSDILVILPFRNLRPDPEVDSLGVALADVAREQLSYSGQIVLHPPTSIHTFLGSDPDLERGPQGAHREVLVNGTYVKEAENLRLFLEFIAEQGHATLWHGELLGSMRSLMSLQDSLADQIGATLHVQVRHIGNQPSTNPKDLPSPAAYGYFLRGVGADFAGAIQWQEKAIQWHEKAVSADADFGPALAYLALDYASYCYQQSSLLVPPTEVESSYLDKSVALYQKAIARNGASPAVLSVGAMYLMELGRLDESVALLRRAVQLNPNYAQGHLWLSQAYRYGGRLWESRSEAELALRLDPEIREYSTVNTYLYLGEYDKFLQNLPRRQLGARVLFYRGLAHYYMHDLEGAEGDFRKAYEMQPQHPHAQYAQAFLRALTSQNDEGIRQLRLFEKNYLADGEMIYKTAQAYAVLGDRHSALRLLRRSIEHNFYCYPYFMQDPLLASVRDDPEYRAVMELARTRHEAFKSKFF
jgi:DNA-binding winged helix-turn-helix (wHTH) protein/tetratricopeptide (TPR) repeat protein